MKKLLIATICGLALAGCRTVTVENNGVDEQGRSKGWSVAVKSNMMKSELDSMETTVNPDGTITYKMGGLTSSPSEEFAKSLMTFTYIARIAAAMYSPAAASVPLTEEAADPQAIAAIIAAQAAAKTSAINAKADAAARKAAAPNAANTANAGCADGSCTDTEAK